MKTLVVEDERKVAKALKESVGLAIAHHVIEINGSRIELKRRLSQGGRFRIVLPAQKRGDTV